MVEWLDAYLKQRDVEMKNQFVDIQGTIGASAQIGRTQGFDDAVEAPITGQHLHSSQVNLHRPKDRKLWIILKQSGDDIDVVYCENDNEAFGAIDAIKAAIRSWCGEGQIL